MKKINYFLSINIAVLGLALTGCSQDQIPPLCTNSQVTSCVQNADELNKLGYKYSHGIGVSENLTKAFQYYKKAADLGNLSAINNVGYSYSHGRGVKQNDQKAFEYYKIAADKGNISAINNIGYMYSHGKGVAQDYNQAMAYYKQAADKGSDSAQSNLRILSLQQK